MIGATNCTVLAWSAGGPYGMHLAAELPDMVKHLCLISCGGPVTDNKQIQSTLPLNRMVIHLVRNNENIARGFIRLALKALSSNPGSYHEHIHNNLPQADSLALDDDILQSILTRSFEEGSRQGLDAMINELIFITRDWQMDAARITCPVTVWHGDEDVHIPIKLMKQFCQGFDRLVKTNWVNSSGHYMIFSCWRWIMTDIAANGTNLR